MLFIVYLLVSYWAVGYTIFADKIVVETRFGQFFLTKMCYGVFLGPIVIPWAIIKLLFSKN